VDFPQVLPSSSRAEDLECDALVIPAFAGGDGFELPPEGIPASLYSDVSGALADAGFKGAAGEVVVVPTLGNSPTRALVVAGLGQKSDAGPAHVRRAAAAAVRRLNHQGDVATLLHRAVGGSDSAAVEGFLLGTYRFTAYRTDQGRPSIRRILALGANEEAVAKGITLAHATALARDLINEPASSLNPVSLSERAQEVAAETDLSCAVMDEAELKSAGFGGILGVGKGSFVPPRFIQLRYQPENPTGKVALVGKGVTFDSGGLSLKDAKSLETMKTDMSGGAAVLAAMSTLSRLGCNVEVHGFIPAVENMPGGGALKPGDVITHYGGRTTEVLNTDAEGRLILADALAFASEQEPDAIVDVATLTGAIVIALGRKLGGLFSNDGVLQKEIKDAAAASGEYFWAMPLFSDYRSELESEIADSKNIGVRYGGAIMGALFLQAFVHEGLPWAHLDIAGIARSDSHYEDVSKGGTGAATRTLINWLLGRSS
jgi:leucyl aminopeptidase